MHPPHPARLPTDPSQDLWSSVLKQLERGCANVRRSRVGIQVKRRCAARLSRVEGNEVDARRREGAAAVVAWGRTLARAHAARLGCARTHAHNSHAHTRTPTRTIRTRTFARARARANVHTRAFLRTFARSNQSLHTDTRRDWHIEAHADRRTDTNADADTNTFYLNFERVGAGQTCDLLAR
eukprot:4191594-Pleurochrysis_carterae.AAC.1